VLHRFLEFWQAKLEGPLHSVTVAHSRLIQAGRAAHRHGVLQLH